MSNHRLPLHCRADDVSRRPFPLPAWHADAPLCGGGAPLCRCLPPQSAHFQRDEALPSAQCRDCQCNNAESQWRGLPASWCRRLWYCARFSFPQASPSNLQACMPPTAPATPCFQAPQASAYLSDKTPHKDPFRHTQLADCPVGVFLQPPCRSRADTHRGCIYIRQDRCQSNDTEPCHTLPNLSLFRYPCLGTTGASRRL